MKRKIRATTNSAPSEREKRNALLARRMGAEGSVLLENDGVLPLKTKSVALYGFGARHTCFGGTGSGESRPRYRVTIEEGLKNAGFSVTTKAWLDALDSAYESAKKAWRKDLNKGLKKCEKAAQMDYASEHPFVPPLGEKIERATDSQVALYVLTRQAGEGSDRKTQEGDYLIRGEEFEQLKAVCRLYQKTILILNVCGVIDLSFTKELPLSAIVLASLAGMEAGNALADVLEGAISPSGRLTATWAERYCDYPSSDSFSYRSGNAREEDYFEDIFVGYRWFHANKIKPRYPFGYGLSYSRFETRHTKITVEKGVVSCEVFIENVGEHAGREVVQVYLSAPQGALKKECVALAGFTKSKQLSPRESEEGEVTFDLRDFASYDEKRAAYLLEEGDYLLFLGKNAEELTPIGRLFLNKTVVTEKCKNATERRGNFALFSPTAYERELPPLDRILIDADEIECVEHAYPAPALTGGDEVFEKLSVLEKIRLLVGTSYVGAVQNTVFGAAGYTTSEFVGRGIPDMPMTDGPQGLNVSPASLRPKQNFFKIPALPEALRFGFLGWLTNLSVPKKGTGRKVYYQYATAFPIETLAAQTFDRELIYKTGQAVGEEMEEFGIVFYLAPAMNIQRNPLCGRNYEYYSEDPILTAEIASAVVRGVQEHKGCYSTIKHFVCNNLETERNLSSSNLSERALREIYLKAFKIAVRKSKAASVMASYNKVNGKYVCNSYALLTDVLRNETGFDGVVMTDWFAAGHDESDVSGCIRAGCDLIMPGTSKDVKEIRRAYKRGELTEEEIALWRSASIGRQSVVVFQQRSEGKSWSK